MKKYELMAIIVNKLDEKAAKKAAEESLKKRIEEFGGKVTFEDFWGAKGFAYKIDGEKWGYYTVLQFDIDGLELIKLEREINIDKNIVRFLVTKVEKDMPKPVKYTDMKTESAISVPADKKEASSEKKPVKKEAAPKAVKKEVKTENKDAVDKKLDQILDDASIGL